jgi:hypothetical protein
MHVVLCIVSVADCQNEPAAYNNLKTSQRFSWIATNHAYMTPALMQAFEKVCGSFIDQTVMEPGEHKGMLTVDVTHVQGNMVATRRARTGLTAHCTVSGPEPQDRSRLSRRRVDKTDMYEVHAHNVVYTVAHIV